jgi:hypothetical protein
MTVRWVCRSQMETDSMGCVETIHVDAVRQWVSDPYHGLGATLKIAFALI